MKYLLIFTIFSTFCFSSIDEFKKELFIKGETIFKKKCTSCHEIYLDTKLLMRNFVYEENKLLNLKAPTGNEISYRLKHQIGDINDFDSQLFENIDFVIDYLYYPNKDKSICLPGVIKHFDTMPSMKGKISEEEIEDVVYFLYFLEGFEGINKYYKK